MASPLLDVSPDGATGILFNVVGNDNLTLSEVDMAAEIIKQTVDPEANIIFGVAVDPDMDDKEIKITLIATGFASKDKLINGSHDEQAKLLSELKQSLS